MSLTSAIRLYAEEKIGSISKFLDSEGDTAIIDVELAKTSSHHQKGNIFRAEVNLKIDGKLLRAEAIDSNLYNAIDSVRDEIIREIKNLKGKNESLFRKGGRFIKSLLRKD